MSDAASTTPDTHGQCNARLESALLERLGKLIDKHGLAEAAGIFDRRIRAFQTLHRSLSIAQFAAVEEAFTLFDGPLYLECIETMQESGDDSAHLQGMADLVRAMWDHKMGLDDYLACNGDAGAWLKDHGHGNDTTETAGR